jgi:hypothetical protein
MTILQTLLEQINKSEIVEQIKIVCDRMMEEEPIPQESKDYAPRGGNIFLVVNVPPVGRVNEVSFLTLEREFKDQFIACLYSVYMYDKDTKLKKIKSWEIKEAKPEKILSKFAEILKHLRGE